MDSPSRRPDTDPRPAKVGVVIVAYNDPDVLGRCLESLRRSAAVDLEIIIADNSLDDRVAKACAEAPADTPGRHYIAMGGNTGFCRASNAGIRKSLELGTSHTLLLNHDTEVAPDCIRRLVEECEAQKGEAVVGGKIVYLENPGIIWYAGGTLNRLMGVGVHDRFNQADDGRADAPRDVTYVTGCCILIPTPAFARIGLLPDRMFMYLDDAEYSLRIRRSGLRIRYQPAALLKHAVGPGRGFRNYPDYYLYFSIRNRPMVAQGGLYRLYLHLAAFGLGSAKLLLYGILPGVVDRTAKLRALAWGILDSLSPDEKYAARFPRLFRRSG